MRNVIIPSNKWLSVVAAWVISELEFIGKEDAVGLLERYWRDGDILDLLQIIQLAQFPEPMSGN